MTMTSFRRFFHYCVSFLATFVAAQSQYPAQLSSACHPANITTACGAGEQIHVIGAYYGTRSGGSHSVWTPADCLQSVEAAEYSRITDSCQGQSTCAVRADKVSPEPRCGSGQTDYQIIEYRCVPMIDTFPPGDVNVVHSCDLDLNTQVCPGDTVIDVSAAYYMDIGGLTTDCTRRSLGHDCRSPVQPSYLEEIKDKCNQNQACEDLDQRTASNTPCSPGDWNVGTEYVAIVYRCVIATTPGSGGDEEHTTESGDGVTTERTVPNTDKSLTNTDSAREDKIATTDSETVPITVSTSGFSEFLTEGVTKAETTIGAGSDDKGSDSGLVVGISVMAAAVIILVIVLTTFLIKRKKTKPEVPAESPYIIQEDGYTALNGRIRTNELPATATAPDAVYSEVDPRSGDPEPSADVTAGSIDEYVTTQRPDQDHVYANEQ